MAAICTSPPTSNDEAIPLVSHRREKGKRSKIYEHCKDPAKDEKKCIWFCRRYGRSVFASDVDIENVEKAADPYTLQRFERWWNRLGFYNIVGIKFPTPEKGKHGFPVIAKPVKHAETAANIRASWEQLEIKGDPSECEPDAYGRSHPPDYICAHWDEDEYGGGCTFQGRIMSQVSAETLEWTPTLLDHYWENGIKGAGIVFLENAKFVRSYEHLAYDQSSDAVDPYGKSVDALELVNGWRVRRLLWTTLAAIVIDICIVAIVTLLTRSSETGLAAGSYAAAIEALLMALLTLLSALIQ